MRRILVYLLLLNAIHLPIPFPDLDGECRGTPINGLTDGNAWHVLITGVMPNDDIDRGPMRNDREPLGEAPGETPFGDPAAIAAGKVSAPRLMLDSRSCVTTLVPDDLGVISSNSRQIAVVDDRPPIPVARASCVCFCSWQV
jgi:hypothetical protein